MTRRLAASVLSLAVLATVVLAQPPAAAAEEDTCNVAEKKVSAGSLSGGALWGQEMLNVQRIWPITKGKGVKVAVIDSGVQADQPLLKGRVGNGKAWVKKDKDEAPSKGDTATEDCDGHGTEVAGIIAGSEDSNGFHGIAPQAEILPYRIAAKRPGANEQATGDEEGSQEDPTVTPEKFADAISQAVSDGAEVINLSVKYGQDKAPIAKAVKAAIEADVIVVAAAGNNGNEPNPSQTYPASYPGVIGVGAVDKTISKVATSQSGPWVDVVAPGAEIAGPLPDGKYDEAFGGTSGATAFVSGTAALLKAQHGDWTGPEIAKQILATASASPGGKGMEGDTNMEGEPGSSPDYGHGLINPYGAVTQEMTPGGDSRPTDMAAPEADAAAVKKNADFDKMRGWALWVGLGSLALFVVTLAGVGALRRGQRRGWGVKKVDKSSHVEPFDDGDPIPIYHGIKGLKQ